MSMYLNILYSFQRILQIKGRERLIIAEDGKNKVLPGELFS